MRSERPDRADYLRFREAFLRYQTKPSVPSEIGFPAPFLRIAVLVFETDFFDSEPLRPPPTKTSAIKQLTCECYGGRVRRPLVLAVPLHLGRSSLHLTDAIFDCLWENARTGVCAIVNSLCRGCDWTDIRIDALTALLCKSAHPEGPISHIVQLRERK